jgi:hypothetical protein
LVQIADPVVPPVPEVVPPVVVPPLVLPPVTDAHVPLVVWQKPAMQLRPLGQGFMPSQVKHEPLKLRSQPALSAVSAKQQRRAPLTM